MFKQQTSLIVYIGTLLVALALISSSTCKAQDYDDEGYGNQGGGGNNQGEGDNNNNNNNGGNYNGNDDGYSGNTPNYQQNVDSDGSNNQPSNSYQPQGSASSDTDGDYEGDDGSAAAAASSLSPTVVRVRRSVDKEEPLKVAASSEEPKLRVKRHGKYNYIGPVYTYVKTDKHANFKWGVKHKVGKKHYG